jgi:hypothetical protein
MDALIGGVISIGLGVVVIAAIYQLGQKGNPIVPDATSVATTTLNSIFK